MRHNIQAMQKVKEYIAEKGTAGQIRSGYGTECTNKVLKDFCIDKKIEREYTVLKTLEKAVSHSGKTEKF